MSAKALMLMWLIVGVLVWNGVFDLYVEQGAREYLQIIAEVKAGYGTERTIDDVMTWWQRRGAAAASGWTILVTGAGFVTIWIGRKTVR